MNTFTDDQRDLVKRLRETLGCGMAEAIESVNVCGFDFDKASAWLKKNSICLNGDLQGHTPTCPGRPGYKGVCECPKKSGK